MRYWWNNINKSQQHERLKFNTWLNNCTSQEHITHQIHTHLHNSACFPWSHLPIRTNYVMWNPTGSGLLNFAWRNISGVRPEIPKELSNFTTKLMDPRIPPCSSCAEGMLESKVRFYSRNIGFYIREIRYTRETSLREPVTATHATKSTCLGWVSISYFPLHTNDYTTAKADMLEAPPLDLRATRIAVLDILLPELIVAVTQRFHGPSTKRVPCISSKPECGASAGVFQ